MIVRNKLRVCVFGTVGEVVAGGQVAVLRLGRGISGEKKSISEMEAGEILARTYAISGRNHRDEASR